MTRWLLAAGLALLPTAARAQDLLYALPGGASADTISTPNAFAAPAGVFYAGVSAHTQPGADGILDGLAVMGVGSGTIASAVEFTVALSDLSELARPFASVRWHFHNETARAPALAVGIEDVTASASRRATPYAAATKTFWNTEAPSAFLMRTTISGGFGGGRFHGRLFGAVSTSLDSFSKAIIEYDGRGLNLGLSLAQSLSPHAVAVVVLARQRVNEPQQGAWTLASAVAWEQRR